jgi:hypothetical protein
LSSKNNLICPNCGSASFVTKPNRYDLLNFVDGNFEIVKSEVADERYRIFCRECGAEIDEDASLSYKKIILA